jgi:hypothetical protein
MASKHRMIGWLIRNDLTGGDHGQIEVLPQNLLGGTAKLHKKKKIVRAVSRPKFEPSTSRIWFKIVTATPIYSVMLQSGGEVFCEVRSYL